MHALCKRMPQHAERAGVTSTKGAVEDGEHGPVLRVRFSLKQGERVILVTKSLLEETDDAWKTWLAGKGRISVKDRAGGWLPYVNRASLIFKLLANADTDAIAAAATTSPPSPTRGALGHWTVISRTVPGDGGPRP